MTPRVLLLYAQSPSNATLSYQRAWPRHFATNPCFTCTTINVADQSRGDKLRALWKIRRWRGDAVVMLHSVFSNGCLLAGRLFDAIRLLPQPKAFFIGNEYKLMPEKMRFCEDVGVSLLVSQCSSCAVHQLYRERLGCAVVGIPYTGLDSRIFRPTVDPSVRPVDLGYRAFAGPDYLGHRERTAIGEYFVAHADRLGLHVDISMDPADRFDERGWADFLNRCKGQLGTEAGGDYFELTDHTRLLVNDYIVRNPGAAFEEVERRFFRDYANPLPLRVLSGRNVEAAGTRTIQVLFDGYYDGYFEPDVHYIPLRKDFSNIDDVMWKFRDAEYCQGVVDHAYSVAEEQLTYERLIDRFAEALSPLV